MGRLFLIGGLCIHCMMIWKVLHQNFLSLLLTMLNKGILHPATALTAMGPVTASLVPPVRVTRMTETPDRFSTNNSSTCENGSGCKFRPSSMVEVNDCDCQCSTQTPIYQDNAASCVKQIPDVAGCPYGSLSDGMSQEMHPVIHLPPFGQVIRRQLNLTFPEDLDRAAGFCYIVECQFLSADGWAPFSTIRLGSHNPRFKLLKTAVSQRQPKKYIIYNLQWLGSSEHADYLQGRIVLLTAMCNSTSILPVNLCFLMRIAGTSGQLRSAALMDTRSQSHFNDRIETGVLIAAACGGALGVLYIIVLAMFVASRLRRNKKRKRNDERQFDFHDNMACEETEPGSPNLPVGFSSTGRNTASKLSESSTSWSDKTIYQSTGNLIKGGNLPLSLRYLYSPPPFFLNDVLIVQTPEALRKHDQLQVVLHGRLENKLLPKPPIRRRKIYFDPEYLDVECLKNPPYEAESFRAQIHCMVNITKSRLDKRKFLPHLEIIDEENSKFAKENRTESTSTHAHMIVDQLKLQRLVADRNPETQKVFTCPKTSRELDAVVLHMLPINNDSRMPLHSAEPLYRETQEQGERDWSQILKDEWGSDESLQQTANREKPVQNTSGDDIKSSKVTTSVESNINNRTAKMPKTVTANLPRTTKRFHEDDDYDDKVSDRSGTESVPEKDSGVEDEVHSSTSSDTYAAKSHTNSSLPVISRKKIISANATPSAKFVPPR